MPLYLTRATSSPETWARLIVGGTLHGLWYSLGSHDLHVLRDVPDAVSMAGIAPG